MKRFIIIIFLSLSTSTLVAQTEQEWVICRDSVLNFVKKAAMVTAADNSVACTVYDIYNTALMDNKLKEAKEMVKNSPEVYKTKHLCDSLLNTMEVSYDKIPGIYVLKEELCDRVGKLRAAVSVFHDLVFTHCINDIDAIFLKEADTGYKNIQKQIGEISDRDLEMFKEILGGE